MNLYQKSKSEYRPYISYFFLRTGTSLARGLVESTATLKILECDGLFMLRGWYGLFP